MSEATGFRRVGESVVHEGYVWNLVTARFEAPDGHAFSRDVVRSPGAVAVVPLSFDDGGVATVLLVRQYRPPFDRFVIEIPAGMRDVEGEDTAEVARRELAEEAGLAAGELEFLSEIHPSPGMTDSITTIYLATDCTPTATDRQGPEETFMELVELPLATAVEMVEAGEICDAKTVSGLLLTERRLQRSSRT